MAFTGTAVVTELGKNVARVTGLSLEAAASGTISGNGDGGDVELTNVVIDSNTMIVTHGLAKVVIASGVATLTADTDETTLDIHIVNHHSIIK